MWACMGCEQALTRLGFARVWALVEWLGAIQGGVDLATRLMLILALGSSCRSHNLFYQVSRVYSEGSNHSIVLSNVLITILVIQEPKSVYSLGYDDRFAGL